MPGPNRFEIVGECWYRAVTALFFALAIPAAAGAQTLPTSPKNATEVCEADDDDDDKKPVPLWKRFAWEGACVELSGTASGVYAKQRPSSGGKATIPILTTPSGGVSNSNELTTLDYNFRIDTKRKMPVGTLSTGFEIQYEKSFPDSGRGSIILYDGVITWDFEKAGALTGGYTSSQMNFWAGDFQFSATAPQRTVGLAGYEFKFGDDWTLTFAYETGLPTSQANAGNFVTIYPQDPVATGKLYYTKNDYEFQISGLFHQLTIDATDPKLSFLGRGDQFTAPGWAVTSGVTLPVKWTKDNDSSFSAQATYAVNSAPYLGTVADVSSFASTIGVPVETKGWSIVGSYHHVFSDHWEANVMTSYISLDISLDRQSPSARTVRYAANLMYKPVESLKVGAEVGYVEGTFDSGGPVGLGGLGLFNPTSTRPLGAVLGTILDPALIGSKNGPSTLQATGLAYYLFATWTF